MTLDYMEQCPDEPDLAVNFKDMVVMQINKTQCVYSGKIEFRKTVGEPWKVNIFPASLICALFYNATSLRQLLE
jgi:hypothetical protein